MGSDGPISHSAPAPASSTSAAASPHRTHRRLNMAESSRGNTGRGGGPRTNCGAPCLLSLATHWQVQLHAFHHNLSHPGRWSNTLASRDHTVSAQSLRTTRSSRSNSIRTEPSFPNHVLTDSVCGAASGGG